MRWLDVGAGFGELVEAVRDFAHARCACEGIEPMRPKAIDAQQRGLPVQPIMMSDVKDRYDIISLIDVFSHVPDFHAFLTEVKRLLLPNGELLIKTGNAADLVSRDKFPGPLTLPDHLVFGGECHMRQFLEEAGFEIVGMFSERLDGLVYSFKNVAKWLLGKPVCLSLPFTSPTRILWIHARLSLKSKPADGSPASTDRETPTKT
jgi:SAM-dependent methyltransferase